MSRFVICIGVPWWMKALCVLDELVPHRELGNCSDGVGPFRFVCRLHDRPLNWWCNRVYERETK